MNLIGQLVTLALLFFGFTKDVPVGECIWYLDDSDTPMIACVHEIEYYEPTGCDIRYYLRTVSLGSYVGHGSLHRGESIDEPLFGVHPDALKMECLDTPENEPPVARLSSGRKHTSYWLFMPFMTRSFPVIID